MRLVDHDREVLIPVRPAELVEDEGEFLDGRDNDLLATLDVFAELLGTLSDGADRRADLRELLDRVPDLLVEDPPVGDDDDGVENLAVFALEADELVREPGDRVRLAA